MDAWQNLGFTPAGSLLELAQLAEQLGFVGVTLPEHLVNPQVVTTPNPYVTAGGAGYPPDTPFLDPWVTFGALATATERLRFLANVFVLPLRDLFAAAKAISTAAVLSRDRVVLGVGIGWLREEFEAVGADFTTRGARTDEMLALLPRLLAGEPFAFAGDHHAFAEIRMLPAPARPVPVLVGGTSDAALRRAARADGWIGVNHREAELLPILDRLARARTAAGSDGRPYSIVVSRPADFDAAIARRYAGAGVTAMVHPPTTPRVEAGAPLDAHRALMEDFLAALP
jgi:probable F420-dependent oxidoreductase